MIAYRISDGLGNQLFQYATARVLCSLNQESELFLDLEYFTDQSSPVRRYCLDNFQIKIDGFFNRRNTNVIRNARPGVSEPVGLEYFSSPLLWDPRVLILRGDVHVQSFGQNWRHLNRIESTLRSELQFVSEPGEQNRSLLNSIGDTASVSVHIRRDDYLTSGYEVCSREYYERAMAYMRERIPGVRFLIFSDTPEWGIAHWCGLPDVQFVTHNSPHESWEDLRLMARCRGHIMANSTFSWWGAWLNSDPGKIVIAPSEWKIRGQSSQYMLLPDWINL